MSRRNKAVLYMTPHSLSSFQASQVTTVTDVIPFQTSETFLDYNLP